MPVPLYEEIVLYLEKSRYGKDPLEAGNNDISLAGSDGQLWFGTG